jgi:hypothetical protein
MDAKYPLVAQRWYGQPEKRGRLMKKRMMRDEDELPLVGPYQVRVFRVGAEYVEDHGQLKATDPLVVDASSVTVVDQRVEVPVVVETRIPSAEADYFTLRATFYCTVTDAKAVVRDGITDVRALLLGHLREVPGLTEDGIDQPLVNSVAVRDRIDARLTAYHEMRPAAMSGLRARRGLIEVFTPTELVESYARLAKDRRDEELQRERDEREQRIAHDQAVRKAELELKLEQIRFQHEELKEHNRQRERLYKELHRQEFEATRDVFDRDAGAEQQKHDLELREKTNQFVRGQVQDDLKFLADNPLGADLKAHYDGTISSDELSKRARDFDELRAARAKLERDYKEKQAELQRLEVRWKVEQDNTQKELALKENGRRWDEAQKDERQLLEKQRDWAKTQLTAFTDLTKQAFERGLFDGQLTDPSALINRVGDFSFDRNPASDGTAPPMVPNAGRPSILRQSQDSHPDEHDKDADDAASDLGGTDSEGRLGH